MLIWFKSCIWLIKMDDEPDIIIKHKKLKLTAPKTFENIHITPGDWFNFILRNVGLIDLIAIKRTCKSFATLKILNNLIKLKINTAFSKLHKQYWNKITDINNSNVVEEEFRNKHPGKLLYIKSIGHYHFRDTFQLGAFSSKTLLFTQFLIMHKDIYEKYGAGMLVHDKHIVINHGVWCYEIYTGINDQILAYVAEHPIQSIQ